MGDIYVSSIDFLPIRFSFYKLYVSLSPQKRSAGCSTVG